MDPHWTETEGSVIDPQADRPGAAQTRRDPQRPFASAAVVGKGRLGSALAAALTRSGIVSADPSSAEVIFVAVPDDQIAQVAASVARQGVALVHCSGVHGVDALRSASDRGAVTGAFHPLQSFDRRGLPPETFAGVTFAVWSSSDDLMSRLQALARLLGGRPESMADRGRAAYHLAATFASNYLVVVLDLARECLVEAGWSSDQAIAALLPLTRTTLEHVGQSGPGRALTGPVARGDVGTVAVHLDLLQVMRPGMGQAYVALAAEALRLARAAGQDQDRLAVIEASLQRFSGQGLAREATT